MDNTIILEFLVIFWDKGVKDYYKIEAYSREEVIIELKRRFGDNIFIHKHNGFSYVSNVSHNLACSYPLENIVSSYNTKDAPNGVNPPFYDIVCSQGII